MSPVLPLSDPLAPAAPPALYAFLLGATFFLHLLAMNLLLGGAVLLAGLRFSRPGKGDGEHRDALARALEKAGPVAMAATVTLGIGPLLFVQALHGRVFFASTILMAWLWLGIVPLAILAYSGAYALALRGGGGSPRRWTAAAIACLLLAIAFLQVTNATRSLRPETFRDAHLLDARGLLLNLDDPTFWPRYLHVVLAAVAVAALATAVLARRWRSSAPARAEWAVRRSLALFALATAANVFVGLALLLALPKPVLIRLVGGGTRWSVLVLALGLLLAVALSGAAFLAPGTRRRDRAVALLLGLLLPTLVAMALLREELRTITFANAAVGPPPPASPQWGAMALFAALLAAGAATIAWMVRSLGARTAVVPVLALVLLGGGACGREPARSKAAEPARYPLKGRVVGVERAERTLTIAHEDIPGFMPAMTMDFVVREKDAVLLEGVGPGDDVTATLVVPDSRYWIEDLVVVKKGDGPGPAVTRARGASPGDAVPDVALVDQDGRPLRLSALKGRAYALTFVFTRCPLPEFCPLMMKSFAAAEAALAAEARLFDATRLVTVSFDPKHDTPEVLRRFGRPFQKTSPPFTHWVLATGEAKEIRRLADALELEYQEDTGSFVHNLRTAVVDREGRLARLLRGNEWRPEELVQELRKAAGS